MKKLHYGFLLLLICKMISAQEATETNNKNAIFLSLLPSYNNGFSDKYKMSSAISTSYQLGYERSLNKSLDVSLAAGLDRQQIVQKDVVTSVTLFNTATREYYKVYSMKDQIKITRNFSTANLNLDYIFLKMKRSQISVSSGIIYSSLISYKDDYDYCIECASSEIDIDYVKKTNWRVQAAVKYKFELTESIFSSCAPFYDVFINKSLEEVRYFRYGANLSVGYRW